MKCDAITNSGTRYTRIALENSKYCWQHQNYDAKNNYFQNLPLLQNTLLSYFSTEEELKNISKQFTELNYEKYNTHIQPHGLIENYYDNGNMRDRGNYKNGVLDGLYEEYNEDGKLGEIINYKNGLKNGLDLIYWDTPNDLKDDRV